jgi:ADP-ribose pyrophosphatase YjhB (NUDIX family)
MTDQEAQRETLRTYTHPDVFTIGVADGWAEPETDPARIGWAARQAAAAIPFEVMNGRPVNPCAPTGIRYGRNRLGLWGENLMADALVTITCGHYRYLLMIERDDGYGWAVPGGSPEPGETVVQAALRELAEETRLAVSLEAARAAEPVYVPDPRASDEAWAVTVPVIIDLGDRLLGLPYVEGSDDAARAGWVRAGCYQDLEATLRQVHGGRVFPAHEDMLRRFLAAPEDRR